MKILQGQIWNEGDHYIQVVRPERLQVHYKIFKNIATREGLHRHVSKKEFCRLIKHANLLTADQIQEARVQVSPAAELVEPELINPAAEQSDA